MQRQQIMETPVLIVGGGPSGLVAALCLAKCGLKSVILEKHSRPATHPKAHEVSMRTLEILTQLGIPFQELEAEASPHEEASRVLFCRTLKEEIGRIDLDEPATREKYAKHGSLPKPYLNLSQTELEKVLRRHAAGNRNISLLSGAEWKSLSQKPDAVMSVARLKDGRLLEIRSAYLLCCDGAGGKCRDFLGIKMSGPEKIQDFANAYFTDDIRSRLKTRAKLYFVFKPDAAGTFIAHHAGKHWVYHIPVMTPHERIEDYSEEVFQKRIASALEEPSFKANIASISSWRMTAQVAETFRSGRAFLVGDAAHRFPPTGGLGLNSGVADAHNLAWKIAAVLAHHASPDLLESYEQERMPAVKANCDASRKNYYSLLKIPSSLGLRVGTFHFLMALFTSVPVRWFGRRFRESALKFFFNFADRRLLRSMRQARALAKVKKNIGAEVPHFDRIGLDLGFSYEAGAPLPRVTEYEPAFSPGGRLPAFTFTRAGRTLSSHALIDYTRFTLFVSEAHARNWRRQLQHFAGSIPLHIQPVPEAICLAGERTSFTASAQVEPDGAVLIRPDGHIALRCRAASVQGFKKLADYFEAAGYFSWRIAS